MIDHLNPAAWAAANRQMVRKALAEFAHERLLVPVPDDGSHLVIVGDPDQLPSVGSGDVLRDLLRSRTIPSVRLDQIHRQAADRDVILVDVHMDFFRAGEHF